MKELNRLINNSFKEIKKLYKAEIEIFEGLEELLDSYKNNIIKLLNNNEYLEDEKVIEGMLINHIDLITIVRDEERTFVEIGTDIHYLLADIHSYCLDEEYYRILVNISKHEIELNLFKEIIKSLNLENDKKRD